MLVQIGKFLEKAGTKIPTLAGLKVIGYDYEEAIDALYENDQLSFILTTEKVFYLFYYKKIKE